MENNIKIEEAIKQEFGCYYLAEELEEGWEDYLPQMAEHSAFRLRDRLEKHNSITDLIQLLQNARNNPDHPIVQLICEQTLIDWVDEPEDWQILQTLLDMIVVNLKQEAD
ncbi:hypothetical protein IQ247_20755 [Plectonema cf. radiosum LEGE 06105]|uniref:CdiI immunity protein domain-containing protein n=1 Tax=Plectonema cf. radiosum LEGE 06105 TaxID=945769 RepID=A0A8J7FBD1_9CYAN|nr:hypothetical protein [Plectonema radiosum]MBE9215064.1 hypothetical protein [Plectonema cf. radiosum LEGE 06105]